MAVGITPHQHPVMCAIVYMVAALGDEAGCRKAVLSPALHCTVYSQECGHCVYTSSLIMLGQPGIRKCVIAVLGHYII